MNVSPNSFLLATDDHRDLAVDLEAEETVNDMAAGLLEHLRPGNIIFLIKSRLQLDEHADLLAVVGRLGEGCDNRRVAADPVQRLLDRKDVRIHGRLADKVDNRVKGHVWVVDQNILLPDSRKDVRRIHELRDRGRCILRCLIFIKAVETVELHAEREIKRSARKIDVVLSRPEFLAQNFKEPLVNIFLHLEADHLAPLALLQLLLDLNEKVLRLLLIEREIRISLDPVCRRADDVIVLEQRTDVPADHLLEKDHGPSSVRHARKLDDARKDRGHLDRRKFEAVLLLSLLHELLAAVLRGNESPDVQRLVPDERERPGRVERHRREDRVDISLEVLIEIRALLIGQIPGVLKHGEPGLSEGRHQHPRIGVVLLMDKFVHLHRKGLKLLLRRHSCDVDSLVAGVHLILQGRDPHHEELVEVRRGN